MFTPNFHPVPGAIFPSFGKSLYIGAGGRVRKHDGTFVPEGVSLPPTTLKHIHRNIYSRSEVNNELQTTSWISELKRTLFSKLEMRRLISSIPSLLNFLLKSRIQQTDLRGELTSRHQVPARIAVLALRRYEVSPQIKLKAQLANSYLKIYHIFK